MFLWRLVVLFLVSKARKTRQNHDYGQTKALQVTWNKIGKFYFYLNLTKKAQNWRDANNFCEEVNKYSYPAHIPADSRNLLSSVMEKRFQEANISCGEAAFVDTRSSNIRSM